eukprot:987983-Rhodomonas_salina.3
MGSVLRRRARGAWRLTGSPRSSIEHSRPCTSTPSSSSPVARAQLQRQSQPRAARESFAL